MMDLRAWRFVIRVILWPGRANGRGRCEGEETFGRRPVRGQETLAQREFVGRV